MERRTVLMGLLACRPTGVDTMEPLRVRACGDAATEVPLDLAEEACALILAA